MARINGNSKNNRLRGGKGNDTLFGFDGRDRLDGLDGLAGNDTLRGDKTGRDTVYASVSFSINPTSTKISGDVERLFRHGREDLRATGDNLDNDIRGDAGDNRISGLGGDDVQSTSGISRSQLHQMFNQCD